MGSFTSLFMHALFNVSIIVSNVVVKYTAPNTTTTMTCGAIKCLTATDAWRLDLPVSQSYCLSFLVTHIFKSRCYYEIGMISLTEWCSVAAFHSVVPRI